MAKVAAIIATRNRFADLTESLRRLGEQSKKPDQIIVVDDFSTDDTKSISSLFDVKYIRLPRQCGCLFARNVGCESTDCDLILSLDDDSWFMQDDGLEQSIKILIQNPQASIITFNILSPDGKLSYSKDEPDRPVKSFIGCGHLARRADLLRVGGYPDFLEGQGEEKAVSMALFREGRSVLAAPKIMVEHRFSLLDRNWQRIRRREQRNDILREIMFCPAKKAAGRIASTWAAHTRYNLRNRYLTTDLEVFKGLFPYATTAFTKRQPLPNEIYEAWRALEP